MREGRGGVCLQKEPGYCNTSIPLIYSALPAKHVSWVSWGAIVSMVYVYTHIRVYLALGRALRVEAGKG